VVSRPLRSVPSFLLIVLFALIYSGVLIFSFPRTFSCPLLVLFLGRVFVSLPLPPRLLTVRIRSLG